MITNENVYSHIRCWAQDRNLIEGSRPQMQMVKLIEEVGELASGIARDNLPLIADSIGDAVVVLTILARQYNLSIEECITGAYNEIKDRRGKMVDGIFIKENE